MKSINNKIRDSGTGLSGQGKSGYLFLKVWKLQYMWVETHVSMLRNPHVIFCQMLSIILSLCTILVGCRGTQKTKYMWWDKPWEKLLETKK